MLSGNNYGRRSGRASQLQLPPGQWAKLRHLLSDSDVVSRMVICFVAAILMWGLSSGWREPFTYRLRQVPKRNLVARVDFERKDPAKTKEARDRARRSIECVYRHDPRPLIVLRQAIRDKLFSVLAATSAAQLDQELWEDLLSASTTKDQTGQDPPEAAASNEQIFEQFKAYFQDDSGLDLFQSRLAKIFEQVEKTGLLDTLQHDTEVGSISDITVLLPDGKRRMDVAVDQVRMSQFVVSLNRQLRDNLESDIVAEVVFDWLEPRLPVTLKFDKQATRAVADTAAAETPVVMRKLVAGDDVLAKGGIPLGADEIALLKSEYQARLHQTTWTATFARAISSMGMYFALYLLCGVYIARRSPDLPRKLSAFVLMQGLIIVTLTFVKLAHRDEWQAELVPLILFGMITTIAYGQEIALLLSAAVGLLSVLSFGLALSEYVVITATLSATVLLLKHIRTRTKLIYVGIAAGIVAALTTLGVGVVIGRPFGTQLWVSAAWTGFIGVLAGLLATGLLPFIEGFFEVQTELSLLELCDVAHPLLQELVRRAPGTYNHSINVASIAEAAADSIGANGLLLRVGAYFHDIGKMLKPQYFIENQGGDLNRHEALLPAMSTLIIIAHVKDGANLAQQHNLPQPIIDLIMQHHGTTLVEYFYHRAAEQSEDNPDAAKVDEGSYRYPGPKPQTREAAVLLMADAVESASRSLTEPAPARIESLVHEIAMKKLLDGQFDECALTLKELRTVEDNLIKSLTAVYHGRVKYPDQQTA